MTKDKLREALHREMLFYYSAQRESRLEIRTASRWLVPFGVRRSPTPTAVLIDDVEHLVLMDKSIIEKIVFIAQRGPRVSIYTILTTALAECYLLPRPLCIEMLTRVAFRVATTMESNNPEAILLSRQGEMFFSHNGKLTRLQTIKTTK